MRSARAAMLTLPHANSDMPDEPRRFWYLGRVYAASYLPGCSHPAAYWFFASVSMSFDWIVLVTSLVSSSSMAYGPRHNTWTYLLAGKHALVCHGPFHHGTQASPSLYLHHPAVVCDGRGRPAYSTAIPWSSFAHGDRFSQGKI